MSGHSKWATIKRKKAKVDAARGVEFAKFSREIMVATKLGGADLSANFRLRTAVDKAKAAGLPNDNIKRAIEKASGAANNENFEEITYEGYGPGGVAVLVEVLTDNNNRAAANVRNIFGKSGGNLGATGSVAYMFNRKGVIEYDAEKVSEDEIMDAALEAGADDIVTEDGVVTVTTDPSAFEEVLEALNQKGYESVSAEVSMVPDTYSAIDKDTAAKVQKLIDRLEEDDDVQNVYTNADFPEDFEG